MKIKLKKLSRFSLFFRNKPRKIKLAILFNLIKFAALETKNLKIILLDFKNVIYDAIYT